MGANHPGPYHYRHGWIPTAEALGSVVDSGRSNAHEQAAAVLIRDGHVRLTGIGANADTHATRVSQRLGASGTPMRVETVHSGGHDFTRIYNPDRRQSVRDLPDNEVKAAGVCTGPGPCDSSPTGHGGDNFVTRGGGFDPYQRAIINALKRSGHPESEAVQLSIGILHDFVAGRHGVTPETQARAAKALARWEALKGMAHAT